MNRFIIFFLLFFGSFHSIYGNESYQVMRVAGIDIQPQNVVDVSFFNMAAAQSEMSTKVGSIFSQSDFDQDLKNLALKYDMIEPEIEVVDCNVYITLKIWEKPEIEAIIFCGNEHISTKKLNKELDIEVGTIFERNEFLNQLNKVKTYYLKKGYFEADLNYEIVPVDEGCRIKIIINVDEGIGGHIRHVTFSGATVNEEEQIRELLLTKTYYKYWSWYTGTGLYHPEIIERDRLVILDYYQNRGYPDVNVSFYYEEVPFSDRVDVFIEIDKGVFYTLGEVTFEGNTLFSDEDIESYFLFYPSGVFSPEKLRFTAKEIRDLYGSEGYIDTNIDIQLCLRPDCPVYDVKMVIEEGEPYCVGMIHVFGNRCTKTKMILHETLLCPGEVFDIRKLEGTEARLINTGYFGDVNVYAVSSSIDDDSCYRDLFIEVDETDTGNLGLFVGANSLDSIFGGVDICERNFNIAGLPDFLKCGPSVLRGRGEYLHMKVNIGKKQTAYLLQWTQPYFLDSPWIVGFDLEKSDNRMLSQGYEIKTWGGDLNGTYIWNDFLTYRVHYRGRHTRTSVRDDDNPLLDTEGAISGFVSAVGAAALYDSTDSPRRPSIGLRSKLSCEVAGVGGDFNFVKMGYFNSYYYPLTKRGVIKFRGDIQFIKTYGDTDPTSLPLSERLFLGGETTVRGYRNYIIGPKFGNNEPRGGVSSYLLSEEYQHNLIKAPCIDAFVFCDAGYVSLSEFTLGRPVASIGVGLRFEIMKNMPISVGYGYPFQPYEKVRAPDGSVIKFDQSQRFFFSVGGCF